MESFKEGMILRIYAEDFLTYSSIELYPCPKLNMIVGPNGTGKSSIVNAIVLGLGGKTAVIGRAKQLAAFVKRGCDEAKIEIDLYSESANYTIGRSFDTNNRSKWTINKNSATQNQIESLVKKFNIQVDNLCQFLPQDKVGDFSKMNTIQLLENTLRTVGSERIMTMFESLKDLRFKELDLDKKIKSYREELDSEKKRIARLEEEVQAIKEREQTMEKVQMAEKKKAWIEYEQREKHRKEVLEDRKKALEIMSEAQRALAPFDFDIKQTKEEIKGVDKMINSEIKVCSDRTSHVKRKFEIVTNAEDQIDSVRKELQRKLDAQRRKEHKISAIEEEIRNLEPLVDPEKELNLSRQSTEMQHKLHKKNAEVNNTQHRKREVEETVAEMMRNKIRIESNMERERSASNKKLELLSRKFADAYAAYQWLHEHRGEFRKKIYGPIMLEINPNQEMAKYVEFVIPQRDLVAFVCEDKDDMNQFLRTVRDQMKRRINVVLATKNFNNPVKQNYQPNIPIHALKQFGFSTYVLDQVDGPDPVLNYLCQNYGLHRIPIGNARTNAADNIPLEVSSYFSDENHFNVRISKYSGEKSSRIVPVRDSQLLSGSSNAARLAHLNTELRQEVRKLEGLTTNLEKVKSQILVMEREMDNIRSEKKNLDHELMNLRTGRAKLKMRKEELEMIIKEDVVDEESEKLKAKKNICRLVVEVISSQKTVGKQLELYQDCLKKNTINRLKITKLQEMLKKKQKDSMEAQKKLDNSKVTVNRVEGKLEAAQREFKKARETALRLTDNVGPKDPSFERRFGPPFAALPNTMEEIEEEISELTARGDCLAGGRQGVKDEYEKTKKNVSRLEGLVANPEKQLQKLTSEMKATQEVWLEEVKALIEKITSNYSEFFKLMNCVGEVSLETPDVKNEYSKYGICIKVKFRDEAKLQPLGPRVQSGGERAVATAVYMLSLQELTTVPFRCVDEINQGMDEINERMVFKLMNRTVEKANSAQCFLLTPKVLHDLEYSDNVRVHCIHAGGSDVAVSHLQLNFSKLIRKVQRQSQQRQRSLKRRHSDSETELSD